MSGAPLKEHNNGLFFGVSTNFICSILTHKLQGWLQFNIVKINRLFGIWSKKDGNDLNRLA